MAKADGGASRVYYPGEDMAKHREGVIVCQTGGQHGRFKICGKATRREGRYKLAGGWWEVYDCETYDSHRFGIRQGRNGKRVIDVPKAKPTFGDPLGF